MGKLNHNIGFSIIYVLFDASIEYSRLFIIHISLFFKINYRFIPAMYDEIYMQNNVTYLHLLMPLLCNQWSQLK